jgi:hypothetical protein
MTDASCRLVNRCGFSVSSSSQSAWRFWASVCSAEPRLQYRRLSHARETDNRIAALRHAVSGSRSGIRRNRRRRPAASNWQGTAMSKPELLAVLIAAILYASAWSMAAAGRRQ